MGCFTVLKSRKKKNTHVVNKKPITVTESTASRLPEPETSVPSLQSAPPSFRNRTKISQPANKISNSRVRALSAPSSLIVDDQDALVTIEIDDQEENRGKGGGAVKEHRFSNPLPLPRPSQEDAPVLKNFGSFKSINNFSGPIVTSGPLPLPPLGGSGLRNFSYEEISSACQHFASDRCVSEGITTTVYKATFGDDAVGSKKVDATVTRLLPSSQAMYNEFSTSNIQIDKDFSAKLSGYGFASSDTAADVSNTSTATANLSVETVEKGLLTPKSNVWSFGIVLLELLTGRKNLDPRCPKEERNIVKWTRPFLTDDCRLSLIMDSRIKGRFPPKASRTVADLAVKCLQKDPSERPTMRAVVDALTNVQDMKCPCRYPLQEPSAVQGKVMLKSPSLNGIVATQASSFSPSPPSRAQISLSPRASTSVPLPPRTCSSTITLDETRVATTARKSTSSALPRPGVEGF